MPKLPSAQNLGQEPEIRVQTGFVSARTTTGTETLPGQALTKLGGALESAMEQVEKERVRVDTLRAEDAFNKLRAKQMELTNGDDGFARKKSGDAVNNPLMDDYGKRFDKSVEDISAELGNDRQKEFFRRRANISNLQFKQDIINHVSKEKDVYAGQVYKGTIESELQNAIERYKDPAGVALSLERINGVINQEADRSGWAAEKLEATKRDTLSKVHSGIIERMLANEEDISAQEYYKANKSSIVGTDAVNLEKQLEISGTRVLAQSFADDIEKSGMSEAEALKHARSKFSGKQEDAVVMAVRNRFQEKQQAINASQNQAADTAWDIYAKTKRFDAIPPAVLNRMDGKARIALEKEAQLAASGANIKTDPNVYYDLQTMLVKEPEKFQKLDLRRYFDKLDQTDREHFIKLQRPDSMQEAATLSQQLSNMHDQMGWGSSDKEKKGVFDKSVTMAIEEEQRKRGSKLTFKERQDVIDRMVINGEVLSGKWYVPDKNRQLFQVYGTEDAKSFAPEIPDNDRKTIVARFKAKGIKPTDEQITQAYRRWKGL